MKSLCEKYVIEPRGTCDDEISTCENCLDQLNKNVIPKESLKLNWIGEQPWFMEDLSFAEILCVSLIQPMGNVTTVKCSTRQRLMKGNACFFEQPVEKFSNILPLSYDDLKKYIRVCFIGTNKQSLDGQRIGKVRKGRLILVLQWLKDNHFEYKDKDILIELSRFESYPENEIAEIIMFEQMDEETVEASAVNIDLLVTDYGIESGVSKSGVIDGNGSNINVDEQSINASQRILYTRGDEFKNEWNCPAIMPYPHSIWCARHIIDDDLRSVCTFFLPPPASVIYSPVHLNMHVEAWSDVSPAG